MKTPHNIDQLILKYLEGYIAANEWTELESWLQESTENQAYLEEMQSVWLAAETELQITPDVLDQEWKKLERRNFSSQSPTINWLRWTKIAAVFILGATLSWGISNYQTNHYFAQLEESVISAPMGAKSTISLPDGSTVILNAGSVLKYSGDFGKDDREVSLEGEAFFEVAQDKSKRFQVRTSDITVKAYGTKFNVKSYADERTIETTLVEGSVSIVKNRTQKTKPEELFLKPHEQLVFYKATSQTQTIETQNQPASQPDTVREKKPEKILISKGIDPKLFTSWTEDRLIMKSEPMQKMIVKIERKYNVKIHFEDADLKDFRFSGIIENETLENVLAAISIASPIDYTLKDRDVWLRKKEDQKNND
ncbi:FecR domain-containing protein [uncultured Sunxiuqinia sp.]|uniref:FecR family protein n=1 Tax=uncultured Sunxiuqinia sp. TaxID=1573825 RepID=UPI002633FC47|nr:FecR domain-containing protein [uncultured Sunxiuqinia sp.]